MRSFPGVQRRTRRTESDTKIASGSNKAVPGLVVHETKSSDYQVQEDPCAEKQLPPSLIDHPNVELVAEALLLVRVWNISVRPLETL